jgi:hypothetical protein
MNRRPPPVCPVCGADVPSNALACPDCGADHLSGWRGDAEEQEEGFDYEEFVEREFGGGTRKPAIHPVWWITAAFLLLAFLLLVMGR